MDSFELNKSLILQLYKYNTHIYPFLVYGELYFCNYMLKNKTVLNLKEQKNTLSNKY